jgi:hypothetical protein
MDIKPVERRAEDRTIGERVAVVEANMLTIGAMLNQIKGGVDKITEKMESLHDGLDEKLQAYKKENDRRVDRIESRFDKLAGAWFALTAVASIIGFWLHYNAP